MKWVKGHKQTFRRDQMTRKLSGVLKRASCSRGFRLSACRWRSHAKTAGNTLREVEAALPAGRAAGGMAATCAFTPDVHGCRSVNRKRLSTQKSVSSQHNRSRVAKRRFQAASADPASLPPDRGPPDSRSAQATAEFCRNRSVKPLHEERQGSSCTDGIWWQIEAKTCFS